MSKIDSDPAKKPIYLDVGNSSIKGAFRKGTNWEALHTEQNYTASELVQWINTHPSKFSHIVTASVREDVREALQQELNNVSAIELTINSVPPELLDYETPETLGIDRFLGCYGATGQTSQSVVVIDAGSALTIDFMDLDDVYRGGIIAPGFAGFMEVLARKAPALPPVEPEFPEKWPGKSTKDSLKWGQFGFYEMAIEGILEKYDQEFGTYDLFITGGQAAIIETMLDRECKVRPFLVFDGMRRLYHRISE